MEYLVIKLHLVNDFVSSKKYKTNSLFLDIVPNDGQYPPHKEFHQKYLLSTGPMCRYACDLQPMLKVLAGAENIERLLHIDLPVNKSLILKFYQCESADIH